MNLHEHTIEYVLKLASMVFGRKTKERRILHKIDNKMLVVYLPFVIKEKRGQKCLRILLKQKNVSQA